MARQLITYRLDKRVVEALEVIANKRGTNANHYLETLLFLHAQAEGEIAPEAQPLGEMRGGKRKGAGRKPARQKKSKDDQTEETYGETND